MSHRGVCNINIIEFDAIIIGSSLANSILFASLSRCGQNVLLLDPQDTPGNRQSTLPLANFHKFINRINLSTQQNKSTTPSYVLTTDEDICESSTNDIKEDESFEQQQKKYLDAVIQRYKERVDKQKNSYNFQSDPNCVYLTHIIPDDVYCIPFPTLSLSYNASHKYIEIQKNKQENLEKKLADQKSENISINDKIELQQTSNPLHMHNISFNKPETLTTSHSPFLIHSGYEYNSLFYPYHVTSLDESLKNNLYRYNIDFNSIAFLSRSKIISTLLRINAQDYIEYRAVDTSLLLPKNDDKCDKQLSLPLLMPEVLQSSSLLNLYRNQQFIRWKVPISRQMIFQDKILDLRAKNKLSTLFLILFHDPSNPKTTQSHINTYNTYKNKPISSLLQHLCHDISQEKIKNTLLNMISYGICHYLTKHVDILTNSTEIDSSKVTESNTATNISTQELTSLTLSTASDLCRRFHASSGVYTRGSYITSSYGVGEIIQAWTRSGCVWGGNAVNRIELAAVVLDASTDNVIGVLLTSGQYLATNFLVCDNAVSPWNSNTDVIHTHIDFNNIEFTDTAKKDHETYLSSLKNQPNCDNDNDNDDTNNNDTNNNDDDDKNDDNSNKNDNDNYLSLPLKQRLNYAMQHYNVSIPLEPFNKNKITNIFTIIHPTQIHLTIPMRVFTTQHIQIITSKIPDYLMVNTNYNEQTKEYISIQKLHTTPGLQVKQLNPNDLSSLTISAPLPSSQYMIYDSSSGMTNNNDYLISITTPIQSTVTCDKYQANALMHEQIKDYQIDIQQKHNEITSEKLSQSPLKINALPLCQIYPQLDLVLNESDYIADKNIITGNDVDISNNNAPHSEITEENEIKKSEKEDDESQNKNESISKYQSHIKYIASYAQTTVYHAPYHSVLPPHFNTGATQLNDVPLYFDTMPYLVHPLRYTSSLLNNNNNNQNGQKVEITKNTIHEHIVPNALLTSDQDHTSPLYLDQYTLYAEQMYNIVMIMLHFPNKMSMKQLTPFLMTKHSEVITDDGEVLAALEDRNPHLAHTSQVIEQLEATLASIDDKENVNSTPISQEQIEKQSENQIENDLDDLDLSEISELDF